MGALQDRVYRYARPATPGPLGAASEASDGRGESSIQPGSQACRPRLDPELSARLDATRVLAAIYVILHHVVVHLGLQGGVGLIFRFGQEAVIVFFLLSGFVIYVNEAWRAHDVPGYYRRRIVRLYPPLLCAMLVSALVALDNGDLRAVFDLKTFIGTLLMMQDVAALKPGVVVDPYGGNGPLWSLSYEAAFYLVFPLVLQALRRFTGRAQHGVGILCLTAFIVFTAFPNHWALVASYFMIWWIGAMCGRLYVKGRTALPDLVVPAIYLVLLTVAAGANVGRLGFSGVGIYPFLTFRHFATALCFLPIGLVLGSTLEHRIAVKPRNFVAFAASISYGLYIFHYPLLINWRRADTTIGFALAAALVLLLSYLCDRRLSVLIRPYRPPSNSMA